METCFDFDIKALKYGKLCFVNAAVPASLLYMLMYYICCLYRDQYVDKMQK